MNGIIKKRGTGGDLHSYHSTIIYNLQLVSGVSIWQNFREVIHIRCMNLSEH